MSRNNETSKGFTLEDIERFYKLRENITRREELTEGDRRFLAELFIEIERKKQSSNLEEKKVGYKLDYDFFQFAESLFFKHLEDKGWCDE